MLRLAKLSIRRPRTALAAWALVAIVLALIGLGVSRSLSPSIVVVPGSESSRAEKLAEDEFAVAVVLDALIVRPVLLPAAVAVLGHRAWWPTRGAARAGASSPKPLKSSTPGVRS